MCATACVCVRARVRVCVDNALILPSTGSFIYLRFRFFEHTKNKVTFYHIHYTELIEHLSMLWCAFSHV